MTARPYAAPLTSLCDFCRRVRTDPWAGPAALSPHLAGDCAEYAAFLLHPEQRLYREYWLARVNSGSKGITRILGVYHRVRADDTELIRSKRWLSDVGDLFVFSINADGLTSALGSLRDVNADAYPHAFFNTPEGAQAYAKAKVEAELERQRFLLGFFGEPPARRRYPKTIEGRVLRPAR